MDRLYIHNPQLPPLQTNESYQMFFRKCRKIERCKLFWRRKKPQTNELVFNNADDKCFKIIKLSPPIKAKINYNKVLEAEIVEEMDVITDIAPLWLLNEIKAKSQRKKKQSGMDFVNMIQKEVDKNYPNVVSRNDSLII